MECKYVFLGKLGTLSTLKGICIYMYIVVHIECYKHISTVVDYAAYSLTGNKDVSAVL